MMLTSDAFLSGAGEMDRLRASGLAQPASSKKANTETQAASGESFPQALKSVQDAQDNAGVSGTAAEAEVEGDVSNAAAVAEKAGANKPLEGAVSRKAAAEDEGAQADALYANLFAGDAAPAAAAGDVQLEGLDASDLSSIIMAIEADIEDASPALPSLIAEGTAEEAEADLDERGLLAEQAMGADAPAGADTVAANLSSINIGENEAAIAGGSARALEEALAAGGDGGLERAKPDGETSTLAAAGQVKAEAGEETPSFAVADFRADARSGAEKARAANTASAAESVPAVAAADTAATDAAQGTAELSFEGDGLLGREGFGAGSGLSLQGARGGEGAASAAQGTGAASFAERLASELRNNAADIVRAGQIILRDGGEGTIRLSLHPETLGAVRIHLEMTGEKKIAGRITVSSREAWDAFSDSMESLVAAFSDEGFDTDAGFDLSWAGRGGSGEAGKLSAPFYASAIPEVMPGDELADDYNRAAARRSRDSLYSVDLFA